MMTRARVHALTGALSVAAFLAAALLPSGGSPTSAAGPGPCGLTTLDATLVEASDGTLRCGPGRPLVVRETLVEAKAGREEQRSQVSAFMSLADFQLADEESPLRGEWVDKCNEIDETRAAFRPHETMVPHLVDAHVRAASALARDGGPVLRRPYSFVVQLGDAADNQQYNEVRAFIDLLDGGTLVRPGSGVGAYEGVQGRDPRGGAAIGSPVSGATIRDLANAPFWARGLRGPQGEPLPWYSVIGNHDVKVQGTLPDDNEAWRTFARAWVTGVLKVNDLGPDHQTRVCEDPTVLTDPAFWQDVAASPGTTRVITSDPDRRLLDRSEWIQEHFKTQGMPAGHGFAPSNRCRDADGEPLARGCYSWDAGSIHYVVLDTSSAEGLETGNVDAGQFAWLERDLIGASSRYFDADGDEVATENADRLIVVFSHHTISTTTNTSGPRGEEVHTGDDLKALLLRFPNVVLQASGHTHQNKIWAHQNDDLGTAYWEVNTSAVADWPTQSRSIEIADNHDGTISIFAVTFDAAASPNARDVAWGDDDTPETAADFGRAARAINEEWLASFAREVAFHDPHRPESAPGAPEDRNVELLIRHPLGVTGPGSAPPPPNVPPAGPGFPVPDFPGLPGLPPNFPTQFPGGIDPTPFQPPGFPSQFGPRTEIGLGAPVPGSAPWGARAGLLFLGAVAGSAWLAQARVRRWMIGL